MLNIRFCKDESTSHPDRGKRIASRRRVSRLFGIFVASIFAHWGVAIAQPAQAAKGAPANSGAQTIRIGIVNPGSGAMAALGKTMKAGYDLAAEQINAAGGIQSLGGAKLQLVYGDSQSSASGGAAEAERLIEREKAVVLVGEYASGISMVISDTAERKKVPFLVPISVADKITQRGYQNVFRINANATQWNKVHVDFVNELLGTQKNASVAIIYEDSEWGQNTVSGFAALLPKDANLTRVSYTKGSPDLTAQVAKLRASKPNVVIPVSYIQDAIVIAETSARLNFRPQMVANGGGFIEPDYLKLGDLVEGVIAINHWNPDLNAATAELNKAFRAKNGFDMNGNSALAYQAIRLLAEVLNKEKEATPAAIRKGLSEIELKPGPALIMPYPFLKFDGTGENQGARLVVTQIQKGKHVTVAPKEWKRASLLIK